MLLDTKLICRNLLYIYTKSEISEIKIKETLQYSIASKKKKILRDKPAGKGPVL